MTLWWFIASIWTVSTIIGLYGVTVHGTETTLGQDFRFSHVSNNKQKQRQKSFTAAFPLWYSIVSLGKLSIVK